MGIDRVKTNRYRSRGGIWMGSKLVSKFALGAALAGLVFSTFPSSLPVFASSSRRHVAAPFTRGQYFSRLPHGRIHTPAALRNGLVPNGSSDPIGSSSPRFATAAPALPLSNPTISATWTALGANPIVGEAALCTQPPNLSTCGSYGAAAGRVTSLVVDPTNGRTVFAGTAGGGVWKSTDGGTTWATTTDGQASLAIGALAIDPTGQTIYAGTGEDNFADSQIGQGLLVSTNGGSSWTLKGQSTFGNHHIGGIAIDRTNSAHVFVASDIGLWETGDGGTTWVSDFSSYQSLVTGLNGGPAPSGAVRQIIQDPSAATTWWLEVSDECQSEAGDILLTTNDGTSWSNVTPPTLTQCASRIGLGVGTGGVAYISAAGGFGNLIAMDTTINRGSTWIQLYAAQEAPNSTSHSSPPTVTQPGLSNYFNVVGTTFGQGDYDNAVAVDPTSPSRAIFGGVTVLTTTNSGGSFTDAGREYQPQGIIHPDFHAFAFWSHDHLYAGNDGGVYKTNDLGDVGVGGDWTNVSAGMDTIQYYGGAALDPSHFIGGAQDNGSSGNFPGAGAGSLPTAAEYLDGDGTYTAIDPNSTAIWASYPDLGIFKGDSTRTLGNSAFNLAAPCSAGNEPACSEPTDFVAPYLLDTPSSGVQRLIAGTNKAYVSTTGGSPGSWAPVSLNLTNSSINSDRLQTMAMTPSGVLGEIMTASRYGAVYVSTQSAGSQPNTGTWKYVSGGLPAFPGYFQPTGATAVEPNGWFTGITINSANTNEAWVVVGGLHVAHVWHTTNLNAVPPTWASIDGASPSNVPDIPTDSVAYDATSGNLYLGTETGILVCSACSGATPAPVWSILGNLPNAKVNELTFTKNHEVVAWTHGRGAWVLTSTSPALFVSPANVNVSCVVGGATPSQTVTVSNKGSGTINWSVSGSGLSITPVTSGTLAAGASTPLNVSASSCSPPTGTLSTSLNFATGAGNPAGAPTVPVTIAVTNPGAYTAITPNRILDTRYGPVPAGRTVGQKLGQQQSMDLVVTGGTTGVPANALAVVLNVTVTNPSAGSFLTVYPAGISRPVASNLNFYANETIPNLVEVAVGTSGSVTIYNQVGSTDVIADVQGYVAPPSGTAGLFNPIVPNRIMDTRSGPVPPGRTVGQKLGPNSTLTLTVAGTGSGASAVPATGAAAVVLNVTEVNPTNGSFLTVYPSDASSRPLASNLNFVPGQTIPNRVMVKLSASGGSISIYNAAGSVDVIVDVGGWFTDGVSATTGGKFTGIAPFRLLDTRYGTGGYTTPLSQGGTLTLPVAGFGGVPPMSSPAAPTAVVLNVTVTNPTAGSFLSVYPSDAQRPFVSDLNFAAGVTVPNLVVVKLGPDGNVNMYGILGQVDVIADVVGWYG